VYTNALQKRHGKTTRKLHVVFPANQRVNL
jgi:hypothetical protein